jgi:hypothetical protein
MVVVGWIGVSLSTDLEIGLVDSSEAAGWVACPVGKTALFLTPITWTNRNRMTSDNTITRLIQPQGKDTGGGMAGAILEASEPG